MNFDEFVESVYETRASTINVWEKPILPPGPRSPSSQESSTITLAVILDYAFHKSRLCVPWVHTFHLCCNRRSPYSDEDRFIFSQSLIKFCWFCLFYLFCLFLYDFCFKSIHIAQCILNLYFSSSEVYTSNDDVPLAISHSTSIQQG